MKLLLQSASFVLKKYVKEHWSPFFSQFKGPTATSPEVSLFSSDAELGTQVEADGSNDALADQIAGQASRVRGSLRSHSQDQIGMRKS